MAHGSLKEQSARRSPAQEARAPSPAPRVGPLSLFVLPIVSGLLLWTSFWLPVLVWIGLVPLSLLIRLQGRRRDLYLGAYAGGLAFFLPGIQWLRYCDPSAWMGWLLLSAYMAIYFPLFLLLARVLNRRWGIPLLFVIPVAWIATEYARMYFMTGFGWLLLAHSIYRWETMIQIADFSGVFGVSFLIALVNAALVELLTSPLVVRSGNKVSPNRSLMTRLGLAAALLFVSGLYGKYRLAQRSEFRPGPAVVLLQTNIEQSLKLNNYDEATRQLLTLTNEARRLSADLVIWPETSYPYIYGDIAAEVGDLELDRLWKERRTRKVSMEQSPASADHGRELREAIVGGREDLTRIAENLRKPLLVGTLRYDFRSGFAEQYNSSVLILPGTGPVGYYDKIHLVPFGEYLPFAESFPFLHFLLPYDSPLESLDAAKEFHSIHHADLNLAPMICFEDTLPYIARGFLRGATEDRPIDLLVNQTNDGWFQGSVEADYHLAAAIFRCVEVRRPMVRVSNTGISGLIDGNGVIEKLLTGPQGQTKLISGNLLVTVPLDGRASPYVVVGDWVAQLSIAICLAGLLASGARQLGRIGNRTSRSNGETGPS